MIYPLGKDLQPWVDFLSLPINDNDIIIVVRNSDLSKPFAVRWGDLRSALVVTGAISVSDEGTVVVNQAANINFTGQGVTVTASGNTATVNIPGGGGGSIDLRTDGVQNPNQAILNLIAGDYIDLTSDISGGVEIDVVGILSSEIITFNQGDPPVTISNQSDNHATQINMGTWDGLSTISIVYNTKTNPKDGAILEIEISDTFSTTATPVGPGVVDLEVKYGSTTIFNASVNADRAIRFRYEAAADVWFPISYVAVVAPPGSVQSVTGVNVDNTDPANPVVDTFSSFESYLTQGATSTITLDANSTPNHGIVIDFTVDPYTSLTVNSYPSPKDGALAIVRVNKAGGQLNVLGAFIAANASQPRTYISKYSTAASAWVPIASIPSNIVSSVAAVAPITVSGTNTSTISTSVAQNKLIGRGATSGTGVMQEITIGSGLTLTGTTLAASGGGGGGTVTSVALAVPAPTNPAFTVSGSPVTTSGTLTIAAAGTTGQYVRGDGSLANFPTSIGGGASLNYYLNGSVNQGTFGGNTYYEMNRTPIIGSGTDFSTGTDGIIARFITDANDPKQLNIPGGNWIFELYFNSNSPGGSPSFYVSIYKYDGASFTLIADNSGNPEGITNGTAVDLYTTSVAVPSTTLALTDRIAVEIYVTTSGRTITLHTEDQTLAEVITTFTTGITALNGLTEQVQTFATGTSGTDFGISSSGSIHTFNLPTASAVNRGALSSADWTTFDGKLSSSLANTNIFVGNASNIATAVAMSGDATIANTGALTIASNLKTGSFGTTVDGYIGVIQPGVVGYVVMPYAGTITGWSIAANVSGSIRFDIWKANNALPTVANTILGTKPQLSAAQYLSSTTLTGWTTTFIAGDVFAFFVETATTIKNATISIRVTKS
jgi:hypothetical protein